MSGGKELIFIMSRIKIEHWIRYMKVVGIIFFFAKKLLVYLWCNLCILKIFLFLGGGDDPREPRLDPVIEDNVVGPGAAYCDRLHPPAAQWAVKRYGFRYNQDTQKYNSYWCMVQIVLVNMHIEDEKVECFFCKRNATDFWKGL